MHKTLVVGLMVLSLAFGQKMTTQGSTTVLPITQMAAEVYMDNSPDADITVRGGGSGTGIAALIDRATDIAASSRPIKPKEIKLAREKGVNPHGTIIARDAIAIVVHPDNRLQDISAADLKKIYTGQITRWDAFGGKGAIVVVSRDVASGTFEVFNEKALKGAKLTESSLMLASNLEVAQTVAQTPGAIGYIGIGYLTDKVKVVKVAGVSPAPATARDGSYLLARPLYLFTNGKPKGLAKNFIDFILSAEGQKVVAKEGFVPVR